MGFDNYEQIKPVNTDIFINYNPQFSSSYKLTVIKDNEVYKELNKETPSETSLTLSETGVYQIFITYFDEGNEITISSGIYNIDKDVPVLNIKKNYIEVGLGKKINIMDNVTAIDNGKNITDKVITNYDELDMNSIGVKKLIYSVSDDAGNIKEESIAIKVIEQDPSIMIFQIMFMIILGIIAMAIFVYNKSVRLEKRIARFSIAPLKENNKSLFDNVTEMILGVIDKINKILYKSEFIKKYSKKYIKYIQTSNEINKTPIDFISTKFLCSIISVIIALFSKTMQLKSFRIYDIYIPLIFGFFVPDFVYYFKYKSHKKKMENDLLQAIIIMNNAFKSGRSIVQAIDLVSKELDGAMAEEFKKMHLELSFGLGLDVVFNRFYNRMKLEEVAYLTASLTILNKSGGNIVEVFSSIEKSLFNKKKLRLELQSLTGGSRIIVNVLMIVPLIFILLIRIINPTYFIPLFSSTLGFIIIGLISILYILYVILVRKLLKVNL